MSHTGDGPVHRFAAIADERRKRWGFQYHPEVDDKRLRPRNAGKFARLCGCEKTWDASLYLRPNSNPSAVPPGIGTCFCWCPAVWTVPSLLSCCWKHCARTRAHAARGHGIHARKRKRSVRELFESRVGIAFISWTLPGASMRPARSCGPRGKAPHHRELFVAIM